MSLKLYDIIQQKLTIRESIGDNYRQLRRFDALTSYFMLNFTYKIIKLEMAKNVQTSAVTMELKPTLLLQQLNGIFLVFIFQSDKIDPGI